MPSASRRRVLATLGTAGVSLAGCLSGPLSSGELDSTVGSWPMAGNDAGHTRRTDDGPANPSEAWVRSFDDARGASTPAVDGERLYVPVDAVSDQARHRYRLYALATVDGETRWQVPLRAEPNAPPALGRERAVVTAKRSTERGRVVAFETRDGEESWLYDIDARLTTPPTIDGTAVYVADWDGTVHALSVGDGSVDWSREVGDNEHGRTFTEPVAVADGTAFVGSMSGWTGLSALDAGTGEERWHRSTDVVTGGPVVDDGVVVVRSHTLVTAFDTDGAEQWTFNAPGDDWLPPAIDDTHVYVPARDTLYAITRNGEDGWTYEGDSERMGPPTVAGDSVLVRERERLVALARDDGTEQWSVGIDGVGQVAATPSAVFLDTGDQLSVLGE